MALPYYHNSPILYFSQTNVFQNVVTSELLWIQWAIFVDFSGVSSFLHWDQSEPQDASETSPISGFTSSALPFVNTCSRILHLHMVVIYDVQLDAWKEPVEQGREKQRVHVDYRLHVSSVRVATHVVAYGLRWLWMGTLKGTNVEGKTRGVFSNVFKVGKIGASCEERSQGCWIFFRRRLEWRRDVMTQVRSAEMGRLARCCDFHTPLYGRTIIEWLPTIQMPQAVRYIYPSIVDTACTIATSPALSISIWKFKMNRILQLISLCHNVKRI